MPTDTVTTSCGHTHTRTVSRRAHPLTPRPAAIHTHTHSVAQGTPPDTTSCGHTHTRTVSRRAHPLTPRPAAILAHTQTVAQGRACPLTLSLHLEVMHTCLSRRRHVEWQHHDIALWLHKYTGYMGHVHVLAAATHATIHSGLKAVAQPRLKQPLLPSRVCLPVEPAA